MKDILIILMFFGPILAIAAWSFWTTRRKPENEYTNPHYINTEDFPAKPGEAGE